MMMLPRRLLMMLQRRLLLLLPRRLLMMLLLPRRLLMMLQRRLLLLLLLPRRLLQLLLLPRRLLMMLLFNRLQTRYLISRTLIFCIISCINSMHSSIHLIDLLVYALLHIYVLHALALLVCTVILGGCLMCRYLVLFTPYEGHAVHYTILHNTVLQ